MCLQRHYYNDRFTFAQIAFEYSVLLPSVISILTGMARASPPCPAT